MVSSPPPFFSAWFYPVKHGERGLRGWGEVGRVVGGGWLGVEGCGRERERGTEREGRGKGVKG